MTFGGGQLEMEKTNLQHRYWIFEVGLHPLGGLDDVVYTTDNEEHAFVYHEDNPVSTYLFDSTTRKVYNGGKDVWE
ncbi:hypothetical protein FP73_gp009 [Bacillus phage Hoody T]|uniref:Uncharacterized protein n=2 Tax=Bastillevirus TaxID=1918010 RepID=A0A024B2C1_9CAUD|nr:hypothetical protein FP73_gp009 [Bacillus phage Hoody T]AHZ10321.1 hypothetical protein [Bacillus phage Hoody T]